MADWNSLTNDEKMARLANLEVAQEVNDADADANLPIAGIVPLEPVAAAAPASVPGGIESYSVKVDGQVVGAIGVAGAKAPEDHAVAQAALERFFAEIG